MQLIYTLIILLTSQLSHAESVEMLTAIKDEGLFRVKGKIIVNSKPFTLMGKSRVTKMKDSDKKIIRIFWKEVIENNKKPSKYFAKPLVMTVAEPKINKGTKIKFSDNSVNLAAALNNLLDSPSGAKAKATESSSRMMLVPDNENLEDSNLTDKELLASLSEDDAINGQHGNSKYTTPSNSSDLTNGRDRQRNRERGGNDYSSSYSTPVSPTYKPTTIQDGAKEPHSLVFKQEPLQIKGKFDDSTSSDSDDSSSNSTAKDNAGLDSNDGVLDDNDSITNSKNSRKSSSEEFQLDDEQSSLSGIVSNGSIGQIQGSNRVSKPSGNSTDGYSSKYEEDDTQIKITSNGCPVKIDYDNDRVIIQNKAITYKKNVKVDETECRDSNEHYLIKKDYLCSGCEDYVDLENKFACPTFEKYWTDKNGKKNILTISPEKDLNQKFPIVKETGDCEPYIDIDNMKAYPQVQLVYTNRVNAKIIAKICHKDSRSSASPITLTRKGCHLIHDLKENWTLINKKAVFTINDKEYTALGCKTVGLPVQHDYDVGVCTTNVNVKNGRAAVMGKRYVVIEGEKIYLSDCEPIGGDQLLMETTDGCENQYVHIQDEGKSYLKKRWYFLDGMNKQFVTPCIKSTEHLKHKVEITDYENDDGNRQSKQITTIYIVDKANKRIDLYKNYINPNIPPLPYELVETKLEPTDGFSFEGCYKITSTNKFEIFKRPNQSLLKQFAGIGKPSKGNKDLCRRVTETKNIYKHTQVTAYFQGTISPAYPYRYGQIDVHDPDWKTFKRWGERKSSDRCNQCPPVLKNIHDKFTMYILKRSEISKVCQRLVTHYPSGNKEYGNWIDTGKITWTPEERVFFPWQDYKQNPSIGNITVLNVRFGH